METSTPAVRCSIKKMSCTLRFWMSLLSAAILTSACHDTFAQTRTGNITQLKLENFGWQAPPKVQRDEWPGTRSQLVSIDHKGRVLVGFIARENTKLATREHPGLSFHILRFTSDGKVDLSLALPSNNLFTNGLYLGSNDQILARANDSLQMLIDEKPDDQKPVWKVLTTCTINCWIHQSPSRRTLSTLIISESRDSHGHSTPWPTADSSYTIFDLSSAEPRAVRTCRQMAFYGEKITDEFAYWPNYDRDDNLTVRFPFCDVDHPEELSLTGGGGFFPLSDDVFLLLGHDSKHSRGEIELVASDGRVKFQHEMPKKNDLPQYYAGFWATSDERGDRFAFTVDTWRGGSRFFDISGKLVARRIVAYDESGQELASIPVSTAYHRDFDFALSPDGHRLAILDEGVVTVAELE